MYIVRWTYTPRYLKIDYSLLNIKRNGGMTVLYEDNYSILVTKHLSTNFDVNYETDEKARNKSNSMDTSDK